MYYQPDIETMPREQLRELQLERMKQSVRHAYDNVAFYQQSFKEAGVTPDALLTDVEEALAALGELTGQNIREDIVERIFSRFCVGK